MDSCYAQTTIHLPQRFVAALEPPFPFLYLPSPSGLVESRMISHSHSHLAISIDFRLILWYFVAFLADTKNISF